MDRLQISREVVDGFIAHAQKECPLEACGVLVGEPGQVEAIYLVTNTDHAANHFTGDASAQFFAQRHARQMGWKILGWIHSHPSTPPRMSAEDVRLATEPEMVHLVVSLAREEPQVKGFWVVGGAAIELLLQVMDTGPAYREFVVPQTFVDGQRVFGKQLSSWKKKSFDDPRNRAARVTMGVYEQRGADRFMVRVRVPAGVMTPGQLQLAAKTAAVGGDGTVHLTCRQSLQIHHVKKTHLERVLSMLSDGALLTMGTGGNSVRNIVTCDSCSKTKMDGTSLALALTSDLLFGANEMTLPRKFKVAISGCEDDCAGAESADVGLIGIDDGAIRVLGGGGLGSEPALGIPLAIVDQALCGQVVRGMMALFARRGPRKTRRRARLRHLRAAMGDGPFKEAFEASWLEVRQTAPLLAVARQRVFDLTGKPVTPLRGQWQTGVVPGRYRIKWRPPLGLVRAQALELLGRGAARWGWSLLLTVDQGIIIDGVDGANMDEADHLLGQLEGTGPSLLHSLVCAGTTICKQGMCNARGLQQEIEREMVAVGVDADRHQPLIRISGCPNSCAGHQRAALGLQGGAGREEGRLLPVYDVFVRDDKARLGQKVARVPARLIPRFLVALFRKKWSTFALPAVAKELADELVACHRPFPEAFYFDFGEPAPFSLAARKQSECAIGVSEMIESDLDRAHHLLNQHHAGPALVCIARALLVTRGVDSQEPAHVLAAFKTHFMETGLFSGSFESLFDRLPDEQPDVDAVNRLYQEAYALYQQMNDFFQFPSQPATTESPDGAVRSDSLVRSIDLRGVICPINFVKAKLALEEVAVGEAIDIVLDTGEPVENVPASFRLQGQKVEQVVPIGNGTHRVRVRRLK